MGGIMHGPIQQQTQSQVMSQQQIQSLKMLELTSQEVEELMQDEFLENPALEWNPTKPAKTTAAAEEHPAAEGSQELYSDEELWKNHLLNQLEHCKLFPAAAGVFCALLEWVDADGLFRTPIDEFCENTGFPEQIAAECLAALREMDPPGIFAANVRFCLLKQAEKQGILDDTLRLLITEHMEELASGYHGRIASALKLSREKMNRYIDLLRTLTPHPLNGEVGETSLCVVPDVVLRQSDGQWEASLRDDFIGSYSISDEYLALYRQKKDPALHEYLKQSIRHARMILNAVEQRRETIIRLVGEIVSCQQAWLEHRGTLQPMTMRQLADQMGVNVSTVSRVVKGKYIEISTRGVLPMKDLFSQEVSCCGVSTNAQDVQERIRALIAQEPSDAPYSDQQLSQLLQMQDVYISRRTVAKYRQEMLLPSAYARKK